MRTSKFTDSQILKALREHEQGKPVRIISRELGIDRGTFYNWKNKYEGIEMNELQRLKSLEEENSKLKQMYADACLDLAMLKDVLSKKF